MKNLRHVTCTSPAEVKQDDIPPSCFSSHTVNQRLHPGLPSATFSACSALFVGGFCLFGIWSPSIGCDVPSGENVLDQLCLGC